MFAVYKITNIKNNMCYIGSSTRVEQRWRDHKNTSKNPNSPQYKYPLYQAFREYGIENFTFEIIADNFESVWDMEEYEQQMIIQYNSVKPNGYNQTKATHSNNLMSENRQKYIQRISQKCAKVDIYNNILEIYNSYHDAARKNGYDGEYKASAIRDVCKGKESSIHGMYFRDLDENNNVIIIDFKRAKGKKALIGISVEGDKDIYFDSISQAAKELNTDRGSLGKCISGNKKYSIIKGYIFRELDIYGNIITNDIDIDNRIQEYNNTNPVINGVRHSISEWCKIYNISRQSYYRRLKKGMGVIEALTAPKRR